MYLIADMTGKTYKHIQMEMGPELSSSNITIQLVSTTSELEWSGWVTSPTMPRIDFPFFCNSTTTLNRTVILEGANTSEAKFSFESLHLTPINFRPLSHQLDMVRVSEIHSTR